MKLKEIILMLILKIFIKVFMYHFGNKKGLILHIENNIPKKYKPYAVVDTKTISEMEWNRLIEVFTMKNLYFQIKFILLITINLISIHIEKWRALPRFYRE